MKKVYFDDLFLILRNDQFVLFEHVPYMQGTEILVIDFNFKIDQLKHDQLIYSIIQSDKFKKLNLKVEGIPHRLIKNKDIKQ